MSSSLYYVIIGMPLEICRWKWVVDEIVDQQSLTSPPSQEKCITHKQSFAMFNVNHMSRCQFTDPFSFSLPGSFSSLFCV